MVKESMLCRNCRYKDCVVVPNYKVEGAEILIVGEAPGEKEEYHGIPFVGPAGSLLRQTLKGAGFDMKKVALCNAVMCRPPKNETPKRQEIEMCSRQFLFKDILEMAPKRIVCVGAVASSVFEGDTWQGIPVEKIMHPAAVLYSPNKEGKFKSEVKKIYNVMHPGEMKKELFVVNDDAGLKEVGTWLEKNAEDIVACDIETTSLDPFDQNAQLLCVAFGYRSKAYSISLDGKDQVFVEKASRLIKERLMDKKTTYIFHRCWFDVKFLESRGFRVASYTDTRLMAFLINENRMEYGLKDLVAEYIGKYEYTLEEKDRHKFGEYNAEDAFFTYKLYQILQKQMTPEIENVLNKIILPCIPALNEMMLTGIKIDQKYAGKLKKDTLARREEAFKELTTKFKVFRGINLGSNPQMQTVLFQVLKEEPIKKTKTGFSVNEETLNTYAYKGKEWAKMILAVRKQEKLLSTYVEKIPKMVNYDGRIRTQFDPTGTVAGRLCVAGDTLLETNCGTFKISELDLTKHTECAILTHEGRYKKILCKIYKGMEVMYDVKLENGCNIRCTPEHRFLTPTGWKGAGVLRVGQAVYTTGGSGRQEGSRALVNIQRGELCEAVPRNGTAGPSDNEKVSCELSYCSQLQDVLQNQVQGCSSKDKEYSLRRKSIREQKRSKATPGSDNTEGSPGKETIRGERNVDNSFGNKNKRILCQEEYGEVRNRSRIQATSENGAGMGDPERTGKVQSGHNRSGKSVLQGTTKVLRGTVRSVPESLSAGMVYTGSRIIIQQAKRRQGVGKEPYMLEYEQRGNDIGFRVDIREGASCAMLCVGREQDSGLCIPRNEFACGSGRISSYESRDGQEGQREGRGSKEEGVPYVEDPQTDSRTRPAQSNIQYQTSPVESVAYAGLQGVWDIEVEEDHSYIAHGFINHNSSKGPNLQNIPRDSKIYRMFVADDGKGFLYFDFAAIELRIACSIAKEPRMIEAFRDGIDLHKRTAAMITGKETEAITKNERQLAKGVSFGLLYGQGADGLKRYLFDKFDIDIPMEEAERIRGVFFKNYNALPAWYARVREEVWKTHQIKYPTGRVRRFPQVKMLGKVPGEIFRQAVNAPVQGCLGGDTRVFVKGEGYKKIADYIGKEVEVWDGKNFVKGMAVASGSKRKVMIELFNGQRIVCSPDHKFLTINTRGIRCWKRPEEFSKSKYSREKICLGNAVPDFGGKVLIQNESINKTKEFPNGNNRSKLLSFRMIKDDFTLGVVLGRLVSDGTIGLKRNVAWLVAEHEYEIREYMKKALSVFGKVRVRIHDRSKEGKKEMTCFCVDSCFLARQADKMNLKNKMPEIVFNNKRILAGFLRGMFDGDGTVDKDNIRLTFGEGNKFEGYALDIQKALELFGIRSRVHRCSDRVNVVVRKIDCGKFARQIGFISSRKQKKADSLCSKQSNNIQGSVESVERVVFSDEYIDMYDIMDSKTHQFMADGFIVHNSANDCMEACIGNVHRLIKKRKLPAKFVLTVHDSCMLEIDEDGSAIDEVEDIIGMVLREVIPSNKLFQWLRVPLVAEFKRGKSWGDLA